MLDGHIGCQANVETHDQGSMTVNVFDKYPLLKHHIDNIVSRGDTDKDTSSKARHSDEIILFYTAHALQYGAGSAVDVSVAHGGPGIATLYNTMATDLVPTWLSSELIGKHLKVLREICVRQGETSETISVFLAVDGTALCGRLEQIPLPDWPDYSLVTGVDQSMTVPVFVKKTPDLTKGKVFSSEYHGEFNNIIYITYILF